MRWIDCLRPTSSRSHRPTTDRERVGWRLSNSFFTIRTGSWSGAAWPIAVSLPEGIADDVPRIEQ
jgi:TRAP-type uncharacterized transport system substrate-binding protein